MTIGQTKHWCFRHLRPVRKYFRSEWYVYVCPACRKKWGRWD